MNAVAASTPDVASSSDLTALAAATAGAAMAAGALALTGDDSFSRLLGPIPSVVAIALAGAAGAASIKALALHGWPRPVVQRQRRADVRRSIAAALAFAAVVVPVDVWLEFPEDMNAPWPESLLFYPAVALIAEVALHLVPLATLVAVLHRGSGSTEATRRSWPLIAAVASIEAVLQVAASISDSDDARLTVFVGFHLFAIGAFEVSVFRRSGFIPMFAFRLAYYALWHIVWGHVRLDVIFR